MSRYDMPVMNNVYRADYVECMVALTLGSDWWLTLDARLGLGRMGLSAHIRCPGLRSSSLRRGNHGTVSHVRGVVIHALTSRPAPATGHRREPVGRLSGASGRSLCVCVA